MAAGACLLSAAVAGGAGTCAAAQTVGVCDPDAVVAAVTASGGWLHRSLTLELAAEGDVPCVSPGTLLLRSRGRIPSDVPLWVVPDNMTLTAAKGSELAAALLRERQRGEASPLSPLISCMPSACGATLFCTDAAETGSSVLMRLAERAAQAAAEVREAWQGDGTPPDAAAVRWALSVVARMATGRPLSLSPFAAAMPTCTDGECSAVTRIVGVADPSQPAVLAAPEDFALAAALLETPRSRRIPELLRGLRHGDVSRQLAALERANPQVPDAARQALIGSSAWGSPGALHELPTEEVVSLSASVLAAICRELGEAEVIEHGAGMALLSALLSPRLAREGIAVRAVDAFPGSGGAEPYYPVRRQTFAETARDGGSRVWVVSWLHPEAEAEVAEGLAAGSIAALVLLGRPHGRGCQSKGFYEAAEKAGFGHAEAWPLSVSQSDWHAYPDAHSGSAVTVFVKAGSRLLRSGALDELLPMEDRAASPPPSGSAHARARAIRTLAVTRRCPRVVDGVDLAAGPDASLVAAEPSVQHLLSSEGDPVDVWVAASPAGGVAEGAVAAAARLSSSSWADALFEAGETCGAAQTLRAAVRLQSAPPAEVAEALRAAGAVVSDGGVLAELPSGSFPWAVAAGVAAAAVGAAGGSGELVAALTAAAKGEFSPSGTRTRSKAVVAARRAAALLLSSAAKQLAAPPDPTATELAGAVERMRERSAARLRLLQQSADNTAPPSLQH
eukprot:TRINITY_DN32589_c0_g1_i1.p1 TRINITY_DN32589_c0_g1~~TRINITY_DN32589_c0_g1_i1.p1  ORF type:complete len:746 (+),score=266.11 TRINITY_DN32589_c0_g1_i1:45-2240(+)